MRVSVLAFGFAAIAVAQNCGPQYGNTGCAAGNCCTGTLPLLLPSSLPSLSLHFRPPPTPAKHFLPTRLPTRLV